VAAHPDSTGAGIGAPLDEILRDCLVLLNNPVAVDGDDDDPEGDDDDRLAVPHQWQLYGDIHLHGTGFVLKVPGQAPIAISVFEGAGRYPVREHVRGLACVVNAGHSAGGSVFVWQGIFTRVGGCQVRADGFTFSLHVLPLSQAMLLAPPSWMCAPASCRCFACRLRRRRRVSSSPRYVCVTACVSLRGCHCVCLTACVSLRVCRGVCALRVRHLLIN
jgi:hypothetical protein